MKMTLASNCVVTLSQTVVKLQFSFVLCKIALQERALGLQALATLNEGLVAFKSDKRKK